MFIGDMQFRVPCLVVPGGGVWLGFGQAQAFEVAAIHPADPAAAVSMNRPANRFTASNTSLEELLLRQLRTAEVWG